MINNDIGPPAAGVTSANRVRQLTIRADVLALLPDPASAEICLNVAEEAARAVDGGMAAAHVGADPADMIAAPEEIDLQLLRDLREGPPSERFERVTRIFESWKRNGPGRERLFLDDCRGDLQSCVRTECSETSLVVTPCYGNMDARDAFHDVIFNERKLVLVPPLEGYGGSLLHHVLIGWKPHEHAERAVLGARRWLAAADRITVLCVNDKADGIYQSTARDLLAKLGLQGDTVAIESARKSVGEAILEFADTEDASCLLIGAFRHGYFLELLLGHVTRHLLSHAKLPLMMKH